MLAALYPQGGEGLVECEGKYYVYPGSNKHHGSLLTPEEYFRGNWETANILFVPKYRGSVHRTLDHDDLYILLDTHLLHLPNGKVIGRQLTISEFLDRLSHSPMSGPYYVRYSGWNFDRRMFESTSIPETYRKFNTLDEMMTLQWLPGHHHLHDYKFRVADDSIRARVRNREFDRVYVLDLYFSSSIREVILSEHLGDRVIE